MRQDALLEPPVPGPHETAGTVASDGIREIPIEPEHRSVTASESRSPAEPVESGELVSAVKDAIAMPAARTTGA